MKFVKQSSYEQHKIRYERITKVNILTGALFDEGVSFMWQLGESTHVPFVSADGSLWHTSGSYCFQKNDVFTELKLH